jgi:hypothetical protein
MEVKPGHFLSSQWTKEWQQVNPAMGIPSAEFTGADYRKTDESLVGYKDRDDLLDLPDPDQFPATPKRLLCL